MLAQNQDISNRFRDLDETDGSLKVLPIDETCGDTQYRENGAEAVTNEANGDHDELWTIINRSEQGCSEKAGSSGTDANGDRDDAWTIVSTQNSIGEADVCSRMLKERASPFAFEDDAETSRAQKRTKLNSADTSFTSPAVRTNAWSNLSLADISVISIIALPLYLHEIPNSRWYTTGNAKHTDSSTERELQTASTSILVTKDVPDQSREDTITPIYHPFLSQTSLSYASSARINNELLKMFQDPIEGIIASPDQDDIVS